ncbi:hypothetical protein BJ165DRAFT_1349092 [Panaeolus papilionaceus]|nr:hypothetical protein BJ165DRAFT_1349092 [Panaeolus papilionaceus]
MQLKLNRTFTSAAVLAVALLPTVNAGFITYGICQTGCDSLAVACYAAAGFTFGAVAAPLALPAIVPCNIALGTCSATCAAITFFSPI